MREPRERGPGLQRRHRASAFRRAAAHLDLAPAGLAAHEQDRAFLQDLDPAFALLGLIGAEVEADNLGTAQPSAEADHQHGPVAQAPQIEGERASMRNTSSDSTGSFWTGGRVGFPLWKGGGPRACWRRMPARTSVMGGSWRSRDVPRWRKCQLKPASRAR